MAVLVLDKKKRPLMPCTEKRARLLLERGRAVVVHRAPFTIRLRDRIGGATQTLRLKLDPGSKTTGQALVRDGNGGTQHVLWLAELAHRGHAIRDRLTARRAFRRRRRGNLRYRQARFDNRTRPTGWLAPSLQHRVDTTMAWVGRIRALAPVSALSQELARFDMQAMQLPGVSGIEYQQGTLAGDEVREYLLEKWNRRCAYCDTQDTPLEIDHIHPQSRGGSNRVSNLTLACRDCNQRKGNRGLNEFLPHDTVRLEHILAQAKAPLRDAAAVNTTRWAQFQALSATGLPVETASGGLTKYNRHWLHIPKAHCLDSACVGTLDALLGWNVPVLAIRATGRGSYQRTRLSRYGFPRGYLSRRKRHFGFQTGDLARADVTTGKKRGTHIGRVAVRASGSFNLQTSMGVVQGIGHRHCTLIQRADGYGYHPQPKIASKRTEEARTGVAQAAALSLPGLNAGVSRATG